MKEDMRRNTLVEGIHRYNIHQSAFGEGACCGGLQFLCFWYGEKLMEETRGSALQLLRCKVGTLTVLQLVIYSTGVK